MKAVFLPKAEELIESSFSRARKAAGRVGKARNRIKHLKTLELRKLETVEEVLIERLEKSIQSFPQFERMGKFYEELWDARVGVQKSYRTLRRLNNASKVIRKIKREYTIHIKTEREEHKIKATVPKFYGRIASVIHGLSKTIIAFNELVKELYELPDLDVHAFTIILAGMPNTGKSTLLARMTTAKPKIAHYPFTTQDLNLGYLEVRYQRVQVMDTPGLLDRPLEEHNTIERKAITALRYLPGVIVFVMDASEQCGYTANAQQELLNHLRKEFSQKTWLVVINKEDITESKKIKQEQKNAHEQGIQKVISTGINDTGFRHKLLELLEPELKKWEKGTPMEKPPRECPQQTLVENE